MDAVISYLIVFLCALLVSLGVIYAYQRGKQAGKLESEVADKDTKKEKPAEPVIYIQFGQAQNELWQTLHQWGVCVTAEQKKGLIDAFTNFAKTEIGFKEGVACAGRGINAGLALKSAKDK